MRNWQHGHNDPVECLKSVKMQSTVENPSQLRTRSLRMWTKTGRTLSIPSLAGRLPEAVFGS